MRKILILAILLMLLAAPVLADKKYTPNYQSEGSTAYWAYDEDFGWCSYLGYSAIGCVMSGNGGPHNGGVGGLSNWAQRRGP